MFFSSVVSKLNSEEEKKAVKRSYQKIQEEEDDEDDDYKIHNSPRNSDATATQLVGGQHCFNYIKCRNEITLLV